MELKGKPTGLKLDLEKVTLKRGDKPIVKIKRKGIDGVVREYVSIGVTGASCSIQNGNALAN